MDKPTWVNVDQNTDEWLNLRAGRIGGSAIGKIMANFGKAFGNPAHDVALKIALEKITGLPQEGSFSNHHTDRGHEQEPVARALYEEKTFFSVSQGGYFYSGEYDGCSPDGLILEDGLIEIKSVIASVHYATVKRGSFDQKYKWQLIYNMLVADREWIDYVEYCSDFPEGSQLFIQKLYMDEYMGECEKIFIRLKEFTGLIEEKIETIRGIK